MDVHHAPKCNASCGGTYECPGCNRTVGWCFGCWDDLPELCDDCWAIAHQLGDIHVEDPATSTI
jgi:hypothetical protein